MLAYYHCNAMQLFSIYYASLLIISGNNVEMCAKWYLYQFEEWTSNSRKCLSEES